MKRAHYKGSAFSVILITLTTKSDNKPQEFLFDICFNRIYNKILDCDWFSARLFVTQCAREHVGVQIQVSDLNFLKLDTCNWIPTRITRQLRRFDDFFRNVSHSF